jgi:hypothetical protein
VVGQAAKVNGFRGRNGIPKTKYRPLILLSFEVNRAGVELQGFGSKQLGSPGFDGFESGMDLACVQLNR